MRQDLKLYQCHKQVHATPLSLGEFREFKGAADHQSNWSAQTEGYLVIYSMGTANEYISWSPKKAFDEGYKRITA